MLTERPGAPSPDSLPWPSPIVDRRNPPPDRVRVLRVLGELMDENLLVESEVACLMEAALRGDQQVMEITDVIDSRPCSNGKAKFLKIYLSVMMKSVNGFTTPGPCFFPQETPFVEFPSPLLRRSPASPPSPTAAIRFPTALRPVADQPQRTQSAEEEVDPKMSPSTNVGSSMDASAILEQARNNNCTVCRDAE